MIDFCLSSPPQNGCDISHILRLSFNIHNLGGECVKRENLENFSTNALNISKIN